MSEPAAPPPLTDEQKRKIHRRPVDRGSWVTPATAIGGIYYDDSGEIQLPGVSPEYWKTEAGLRTRKILESYATGGRWNEYGRFEEGAYTPRGKWSGTKGPQDTQNIVHKTIQGIPGYDPSLLSDEDRKLFESSWTPNALNNFFSTYTTSQAPINENLAKGMVAGAAAHIKEYAKDYDKIGSVPEWLRTNWDATRRLNQAAGTTAEKTINPEKVNRPPYTPYFWDMNTPTTVEHLIGGSGGKAFIDRLDRRAQKQTPFRDEKWDERPSAGTRYTIPAQ